MVLQSLLLQNGRAYGYFLRILVSCILVFVIVSLTLVLSLASLCVGIVVLVGLFPRIVECLVEHLVGSRGA